MKISSFDKKSLQILRAELEKVLKQYGPEGVEFSVGNIRFSSAEAKIELKATVEGAMTQSDIFLETRVASMGLKLQNAQGWKLVGYKASNWKMPFLFTKPDGKTYKMSDEQAKIYFK